MNKSLSVVKPLQDLGSKFNPDLDLADMYALIQVFIASWSKVLLLSMSQG